MEYSLPSQKAYYLYYLEMFWILVASVLLYRMKLEKDGSLFCTSFLNAKSTR